MTIQEPRQVNVFIDIIYVFYAKKYQIRPARISAFFQYSLLVPFPKSMLHSQPDYAEHTERQRNILSTGTPSQSISS